MGFPNYDDENRRTIVLDTEYTAEENLWLIIEPISNESGGLEITIDGVLYLFSQSYVGMDYPMFSQSIFPIKKGTTYKVVTIGTVYAVDSIYDFGENNNFEVTEENMQDLIASSTVGFPKYDDENKITIASNMEYTANENCWLIVEPLLSGESTLTITVNNTRYNFYKGYSGTDYNHISNSMFPLKNGDVYKVEYSGCTVYKVSAEYNFNSLNKGNKTLSEDDVLNMIKLNTICLPNYNSENKVSLTSNTQYIAEENVWLLLTPVMRASTNVTLTVNGVSYNFYQGYSGKDYSHPTQGMFPIKKGSTYSIEFEMIEVNQIKM